jgi:hypothetical protein
MYCKMKFCSHFQLLFVLMISTGLLCPTSNDRSVVTRTGTSVHLSASVEGTHNQQYKPISTKRAMKLPTKPVPALGRRLCHKEDFSKPLTHSRCDVFCLEQNLTFYQPWNLRFWSRGWPLQLTAPSLSNTSPLWDISFTISVSLRHILFPLTTLGSCNAPYVMELFLRHFILLKFNNIVANLW